VIVDEARNHRDRDHLPRLFDYLAYLLVLQPYHVLSFHFEQLVVGQDAVPGGRRVLDDGDDFAVFELEPDAPDAVLVQSYRPLEGPVPHDHADPVDGALAEHVVDLLHRVPRHVHPVHLQDLVAESQPREGRRRVVHHQADEDAVVDGLDSDADLAVFVLAEGELADAVAHVGPLQSQRLPGEGRHHGGVAHGDGHALEFANSIFYTATGESDVEYKKRVVD
jgi:hypothetical protein